MTPFEVAVRVVLVDDSRPVQEAFRRLLESGAGVEVVDSAEDALGAEAAIERSHPEVVVLDIHLRGGDDGYALLKTLRRRWPAIEVVVLSNDGAGVWRTALLEAGASACFDKALEFRQAVDWLVARAGRGHHS